MAYPIGDSLVAGVGGGSSCLWLLKSKDQVYAKGTKGQAPVQVKMASQAGNRSPRRSFHWLILTRRTWKPTTAVTTAYAPTKYFPPVINNYSCNNVSEHTSYNSGLEVCRFNFILIFSKEAATNQSWRVFFAFIYLFIFLLSEAARAVGVRGKHLPCVQMLGSPCEQNCPPKRPSLIVYSSVFLH